MDKSDNTFDEYTDWEYHIKSVKIEESIDWQEKQKIITGFNRIKEIFGEDWLKEAFNERHPIALHLLDLMPFTRNMVGDFGNRLFESKDVKNFEYLKKRLMSNKTYYEAETEFEILSILKQAGLGVEIIIPTEDKSSDILVKLDGKEVYFEITRLLEAYEQKESEMTVNELTWPFLMEKQYRNISIEGKIHKPLSGPTRKEILKKMRAAAEKAETENKWIELSIPKAVDFIIYPRGNRKGVEEWLKSKNLRMGIEWPFTQIDETKRIRGKIEDKVKQIPRDKLGVIVVYDSRARIKLEPKNIDSLVDKIEEKVYDYNNLLGLVILTSLTNIEYHEGFFIKYPQKHMCEILEKESFFLSTIEFFGILLRKVLVIKNRYISPSEYEKVLDVFRCSNTG